MIASAGLFAALQEATVAEDPLAPVRGHLPSTFVRANDAVYVRAELPGLKADQIHIGLTNTQLRIWGDKKTTCLRDAHHFASLFRTKLR